jgi:hypothetical protein
MSVVRTMVITLNGETLEAIKCTGALLLSTEIKVSLENHAFSVVDAAVLLADAHISHDKSCSETHQGDYNLSHIYIYIIL